MRDTARNVAVLFFAALLFAGGYFTNSLTREVQSAATTMASASVLPDAAKPTDDETPLPAMNVCGCGQKRTCPFGPGIVGEQRCWTNWVRGNVWSRCEPKGVANGEKD